MKLSDDDLREFIVSGQWRCTVEEIQEAVTRLLEEAAERVAGDKEISSTGLEATDWEDGRSLLRDYFVRVTPLDAAGRRALWLRYPPADRVHPDLGPDGTEVELRSGREGDDDRITLREGTVMTKRMLVELVGLLLRVRHDWADE